ncbi:MAG: efflux RND transporter periplasmic adaptor subunit [Thermotaleaceae bacterium]
MAKLNKKKLLVILAGIIIISFVTLAGVKASQSKQEKGKGALVKTVALVREDIESHILTSGEILTMEKREIVSEVNGRFQEIYVKKGDKVEKGQILLSLDTADLSHKIRQAEIQLAIEQEQLQKLKNVDKVELEILLSNAEMKYHDAQKDYTRKEELYQSGAVSKQELDEAKTTLDQSNNSLELAKHNLDKAINYEEIRIKEKQIQVSQNDLEKLKQDREKCNIDSPISGTVVDLKVTEGVFIPAETPIMTVEDTNNLEITTNISEYDVSKIQIGQTVKVTGDAFEGKEYKGRVKYIGPAAFSVTTGQGKETVVEIKIEVEDKNTELKPGFSANVDILTESRKAAFVVPYEAIFTKKNGEKVVFTIEDGTAKEHRIQTGIESDLRIEIISDSLKENDSIILDPSQDLKEGDLVRENKVVNNDKN